MKIVVCLKQVPDSREVEIDEQTGVLKRDGIRSKMNPYDLYALEWGLRLKERWGGRLYAITMGPPQAETILREALAMGADEVRLLSDRAFAGADVLATSYTLAKAIQKLDDYDVILCGKQTIDGDTAQVGSSIAEWLSIPHLCNVKQIEKELNSLRVEVDYAEFMQTCLVQTPCLLTVEKDSCVPRLPSYLRQKATRNQPIIVWDKAALVENETEAEYFGLSGSATQVEKMFPPPKKAQQKIFQKEASLLAQILVEELKNRNLLQNHEGTYHE